MNQKSGHVHESWQEKEQMSWKSVRIRKMWDMLWAFTPGNIVRRVELPFSLVFSVSVLRAGVRASRQRDRYSSSQDTRWVSTWGPLLVQVSQAGSGAGGVEPWSWAESTRRMASITWPPRPLPTLFWPRNVRIANTLKKRKTALNNRWQSCLYAAEISKTIV